MIRPKRSKKFQLWRHCTINAQTCSTDFRLTECIRQFARAGIHIGFLQETRKLNIGSTIILVTDDDNIEFKYEVHWSGYKTKKQAGVAIAIRIDNNIDIGEITYDSPRLMTACVNMYGCHIKAVNGYAPTELGTDNAKTSFYKSLCKVTVKPTKRCKLLVAGDFNATTSAALTHCSFRSATIVDDLISNNNGDRFLDFCRDANLSILNTWFYQPNHRRYTWHSPTGFKKVIDYTLSDSWLRQYTRNCRVKNSFDFMSDHRPLITTFITPVNRYSRYRPRRTKPKKHLDLAQLHTPHIRAQYQKRVCQLITESDRTTHNIDIINSNLVESINTAASETIPRQTKSVNTDQPWRNDSKLLDMVKKRDQTLKMGILDDLARAKLNKDIRRYVKILENNHMAKEAECINEYAASRKIGKFFEKAKAQRSSLRPASSKSCPPDAIYNHFKAHFSPPEPDNDPPEILNPPDFIQDLQQITAEANIDHSPPTFLEVKNYVTKLKYKKASNDVQPELLKQISEHTCTKPGGGGGTPLRVYEVFGRRSKFVRVYKVNREI